jgi:hypothetical protein
MSKLSFLLGVVTLCIAATFTSASEEATVPVKPYIFNNHLFFSDRPLIVMNGRLVYEDTREDFVVASGQKVDASYSLPAAPMCVGCKNTENTPLRVLRLLKIPFDRCLIPHEPIETIPVPQDPPSKKEESKKA